MAKAFQQDAFQNYAFQSLDIYPNPYILVEIAFASNPFDATPIWKDVSSDLVMYSLSRGRQHELDRFEAGTATVLLKNLSGDYWPNNAGGAHYPNVDIGKRLRIRAVFDGMIYNRYTGYIESWEPAWLSEGGLAPVMYVNCADALSLIARRVLNNAGYGQQASGDRIKSVLDSIVFPAADRMLDIGQYIMIASGALENANALEHSQKVAESEIGIFLMDGQGYAIFEDRSHRTKSPHDASQHTFANAFQDVQLALDDPLLYNEVRATREGVGAVEQVASNAASQTAYGLRSLVRSGLLLTTDAIVKSYAIYLLARYANTAMRAKRLIIKPLRDPATYFPLTLGYGISTRIKVQLTQGSIDKDYFIEGISEEYDSRIGDWTTQWQLSDAEGYLAPPDATEDTIRPNANGDTIQLTPSAGANWECVDEITTDEDTSYVEANQSAPALKYDFYNLESPPYQQGAINKITVYARIRDVLGGGTFFAAIRILTGGNIFASGNIAPTDSYANYSYEWALNPDTGIAWTWADLVNLQAGLQLAGLAGWYTKQRCTQLYVVVNYTPTW